MVFYVRGKMKYLLLLLPFFSGCTNASWYLAFDNDEKLLIKRPAFVNEKCASKEYQANAKTMEKVKIAVAHKILPIGYAHAGHQYSEMGVLKTDYKFVPFCEDVTGTSKIDDRGFWK